MTALTVPAGNLAGMVFSLIVAVGVPIALCILIRKKLKADILPFFLGAGVFFLFAMLLEQLLHMAVLLHMGSISEMLKDNLWLFAIYGGLAAGVFEETGRFLCMKFLMKKSLNRANAVMYGAGHGGLEAILILGMASINNLVSAVLLNTGAFTEVLAENVDARQALEALSPLAMLPAWQFFLGGIERLMAMALQIALSLLVFQAVRERRSRYLYPVAILLHALVNGVVVMIANHGSLVLAEVATLAGTLLIGTFAWKTVGFAKDNNENQY